MLVTLVGIIILLVLAALYAVGIYNRLVKQRMQVDEAWSGIDVQLKKRYNLIPNLVETVKGFASHEKETFMAVTNARNAAQSAQGPAETIAAEKKLNQSMMNLFAVAESYPELKSNTNFMQLQNQLSEIEGDIEKSRRYYNGCVREKNTTIESFPSNIVANSFGFDQSEFYEIEEATQRENVQVKF